MNRRKLITNHTTSSDLNMVNSGETVRKTKSRLHRETQVRKYRFLGNPSVQKLCVKYKTVTKGTTCLMYSDHDITMNYVGYKYWHLEWEWFSTHLIAWKEATKGWLYTL